MSLDGELSRELGDRQDPLLGALILVVSGPVGLSSLLYCCALCLDVVDWHTCGTVSGALERGVGLVLYI